MIRFVFRFLSFVVLVCAVIAATMDSIQSVSASQVLLTSLGTAWAELDPGSLQAVRMLVVRYLEPVAGPAPLAFLLAQPGFAVLLALSLLLWMVGYRKPRAAGRFAV